MGLASGCSGGGSSTIPTATGSSTPGATPVVTTSPGTGESSTTSIAWPAGGGAIAIPPLGSYGITLDLTAAGAGAGTQTTLDAQTYSPAGLPVISRRRRADAQQSTPLLFVTISVSAAVSIGGYPGFTFQLPSDVTDGASFALEFYDPTHASLGWQTIGNASGQYTFPAGSTPLTFAANETYVFALVQTVTVAPSASPSPSPTASATPLPGAVPALSVTSFGLQDGFQYWWLTSGPDGNIWATLCPYEDDSLSGSIVKMTTNGTATPYQLAAGVCPQQIVSASDNNLWFSEGTSSLGRITTAGLITEYPVTGTASALAAGSDGNLWYGSGNMVYGFDVSTRSVVGTASLPSGYVVQYLANNTATGDMVVEASNASGLEIFSFAPAASPTVEQQFAVSSHSGYTASQGPLSIGADGNIYGILYASTTVPNTYQLLQLSDKTYAASYLNLPSSFIYGTGTYTSVFGEAMVASGTSIFLPNGIIKSSIEGGAQVTEAGVMVGQADNDQDDTSFYWNDVITGPDGNIWAAAFDGYCPCGSLDRLTPLSASGDAARRTP